MARYDRFDQFENTPRSRDRNRVSRFLDNDEDSDDYKGYASRRRDPENYAGGTKGGASRSQGRDFGGRYGGPGYPGGGPEFGGGNRRARYPENEEDTYYSSRAAAFGYNEDRDEDYNRGYEEGDIYDFGDDDDREINYDRNYDRGLRSRQPYGDDRRR